MNRRDLIKTLATIPFINWFKPKNIGFYTTFDIGGVIIDKKAVCKVLINDNFNESYKKKPCSWDGT